MNRGTRTGLLALLLVLALVFGQQFYADYTRLMQDTGEDTSAEQATPTPADRKLDTGSTRLSRMVIFGSLFFVTVLSAGLMAAHDLSHFVASKAMTFIYDEDLKMEADPDYEEAEKEWADGNHLEAIRLMREYVQRKPREVHALIRIAEIYEKDLQNPLAAAMEYEEILKHKLKPERWGWAAIHLCNLYTSKLHMQDKAVALLLRVESECAGTPPAEKANKRLAMLYGEEPAGEEDAPPAGKT